MNNMTEFLTFAKILDELFKGLSECGLMSSYMVRLQSNLVGLETSLKFRSVIQELIERLKNLLINIPSTESVEVSTQTLEKLVVTCHPITVTTVTESKTDNKTVHKKEKVISDNSYNIIGNVNNSGIHAPAIEICELKPFLLEANENFSQLIHYPQTTDFTMKKDKVDNVVHIVVETPSGDSEQSFHNAESKTDEKIEEVKCKDCDRVFKDREEQRLHVHALNCDICDKAFTYLQNLQDHFRQEHNGVGCFSCPSCSKRFMTKLSYNRHIDTHKEKKDAICNLCGKGFSRRDYLQTHYKTHLGKRNYACSHCPRKFVRSIHLKVHEKIHSGIKDHVCKVCNKGFVRRDKLKEHVLRHLNIKRFQCAICCRDYAEKRDLKVHVKSHSK